MIRSLDSLATRIVSLDIEGNGGRPSLPIEIAIVEVHPSSDAHRTWLVRSPEPISKFATRIHGLRDAHLADAPTAEEVEADLLDALGNALIVGHSIRDDLKCLHRAFPNLPGFKAIDTLPMSRQLMPGLPGYSLQEVAKALGVKPARNGRGPHSALYDAGLGAGVFMKLCFMPAAGMYLRGVDLKEVRGRTQNSVQDGEAGAPRPMR